MMSSLVHTDPTAQRATLGRVEAVAERAAHRETGTGVASALLAALVAAMVAAADQLIDSFADAHGLAAWVVLWAVAFAALALFSGASRQIGVRVVAALDAWSQRVAQARADQRILAAARTDPRVMAELMAATQRCPSPAATLGKE